MNYYLDVLSKLTFNNKYLNIILIVWSLIIKGITLWKCSKNNQKYWFITIFLVNTLGILEIIYLKFFQKKIMSSAKLLKKV